MLPGSCACKSRTTPAALCSKTPGVVRQLLACAMQQDCSSGPALQARLPDITPSPPSPATPCDPYCACPLCRRLKAASGSKLSQPYDISSLQEVLGALPSWLAGIGGATEELGWLNKLLAQVGGAGGGGEGGS